MNSNHVGGNGLELDGNGRSTIVEDFFNADSAFDLLVEHPATMAYINAIIQDRPTINNSELRLRYDQGERVGGRQGREGSE